MKKAFLCCICLLLLLQLCACGGTSQTVQTPAAAADAAPVSAPTAEPTPAPTPEPVVRQIHLHRSRADGADLLEITEDARYLARVMLPDENTAVDHWEVNGKTVDPGDRRYSLEFSSEGVYLVEAFLRPVRKLLCENCYMQFLDEDGRGAGDMYRSVTFEDYYIVPTTGEAHGGGTVSGQITAIVPQGMMVDYWLFNDTAMRFEENVTSFILIGVPEYLRVEPVFKGGSGRTPVTVLLDNYDPNNHWTGDRVTRPEDDRPDGTIRPDEEWKRIGAVTGDLFTPASPSPSLVPPVTPEPTTVPAVTAPPETTPEPEHQHEWYYQADSYPATCDEPGLEHLYCPLCGANVYNDIPPTGHNLVMYSEDSRAHWLYCTVCDAVFNYEPHTIVHFSYDRNVCSVCGHIFWIIN